MMNDEQEHEQEQEQTGGGFWVIRMVYSAVVVAVDGDSDSVYSRLIDKEMRSSSTARMRRKRNRAGGLSSLVVLLALSGHQH